MSDLSRLAPLRLDRSDRLALLVVIAATALARFIPAWLLGTEVADLSTYRHMALTVLRNQDIYDIPTFFPYTPLSLFLPVVALRLSDVTGIPFHLTMKIFPLAGDLGTAALVYLVARRRWPTQGARLAGLAFAFNPVSILVTGFHGNIMPLSAFFAFWAYYLVEFGETRRSYILSALALGVGIGLRSWPVVLTPLLARAGKMRWRQRAVYFIVAALPAVLSLAPYMLFNSAGVLREAFDYKSTPDFGWVAIWRHWHFLNVDNVFMPWPKFWVENSRFYFLIAYGVLVALAYLRPHVIDTAGWVMAALLLDYTMLGGVAAQYFSWILPFLVLRPLFGTIFSFVAAGAMLGFYLTWHPAIVLGHNPPPIAYTSLQLHTWTLCFLVSLWSTGFLWLLWLAGRIVLSMFRRRDRTTAAVGALAADGGGSDAPRITRGIAVLTGTVLLAVTLEVPYILRSQPASELPARIAWVFNQRGREPGQISTPIGVAVHPSGDIYVADPGNARVERFAADGSVLSLWPATDGASPKLLEPYDVAVGASGAVYVLDSGTGMIDRLEADGWLVELASLAPLTAYTPRGLAVDEARHRFYVADTGRGRVLVVAMDGTLIAIWGSAKDGLSFNLGWGIGVDSHGNVLVGEQGNSRIRKFSPEGVVLAEWWAKGDLYDIATGPDDRVYVTASDRARVWIYDSDGNELGQVTTPLAERGQPRARGVAVAGSGDVIVTTEASVVRLVLPR